MNEEDAQRHEMVEKQLQGRDIFDERVLETMRRVPRHAFVPESLRPFAYQDRALSIGHEQTISQPYVVALMLQTLQLSGHENVLEIGTGSGYQTAILSELCAYVYSVERHPQLAEEAGQRLGQLGYRNVDIHVGDGSQGLPDMSPFDAIVVSACVPAIPAPLRGQLRPQNGRLILPVGNRSQQYLKLAVRDYDQWRIEQLIAVRFVPLIGRYGFNS
jgi:protein-L-isoaspartate(D-aspartate) O-methyltransferase